LADLPADPGAAAGQKAGETPTDWFRIRHVEPFSDEAFAAFRGACAILRARIEATLENWSLLPNYRDVPRPTVRFFPPERSADARVMSFSVCVVGQTLGSRHLLQSAAVQLHHELPMPLPLEVEVGVKEPALDGRPGAWREHGWDPKRRPPPVSAETIDALRKAGARVVHADDLPDVLDPVHGWRRWKRRFCSRMNRWCRDA